VYGLEIVLVIVAVYLAPALALRPSLALKPETSVAIPFISVCCVFILQTCLTSVGLYTPVVVQLCSGLILLIAVIRVSALRKNSRHQAAWGDFAKLLFVLNVALCIRFGSMLLIKGFDLDDEVYSWNMWAVQHFLGQAIDFSYTQAPYPQLFPKLLSYCYMVLGSVESQTAVKTSLIIFPFAIVTALGLASNRREWKILILHFLLCLFVLRNVDLKHLFDDGMPDTMTAAAVLVSIYLLQLYRQRRDEVELLWLCLACAVVAVLTKQTGLVWGLFSLPVLLAIDAIRQRESWKRVASGVIPALFAVAWMLTEGRNFEDNTGVVSRSFADRDILGQLWFSADTWFIQEPTIAVLVLLAVFSVFRAKHGRDVLLLFAVPSLAMWFLFASYDMRAGEPALLAFAFLVAYGGYGMGRRAGVDSGPMARLATPYKFVLAGLLLATAATEAVSTIQKQASRIDGYEVGYSQRNNLFHLFGPEAAVVFERVRDNKEARLWAPTHYVYGLFYGYSDVTRPHYPVTGYTAKTLVDELRTQERNYATNSGDVPAGPGGKLLDQLATQLCPELFIPIAGPDNKFHITVYEIDTQLLNTDYCSP
jgi:hypothetical protein